MRDARGLDGMEGMTYVASVPHGEIITSMVTRGSVVLIATDYHLYKLVDDKRLEATDDKGVSV